MEYIGTALSTDLIQMRRPLLAIRDPWQFGIFLAMASTKLWYSALGSLFVLSGRPKYLMGND